MTRNALAGICLLLSGSLVWGEDAVERIRIPVGEMTFDALAIGPAAGEPVLLLHGFPQTSHSFRRLMPDLAAAGFRVVAPDQRGYSPDARPDGVAAYAMPNLIGDVIGIANSLGFEKFHIAGHDWGAAVAWVVAGAVPHRVYSLVAISTPHPAAFSSALTEPDSEQAQRSSYMQFFASEGSEVKFLENDAQMLRSILSSPPIPAEDQAVYLQALGSQESLAAALNWYRALLAGRQSSTPPGGSASGGGSSAAAPSLSVPTTYLWGTSDMAFSSQAARASQAYVSGPYHFHELEGIGHWVLEEAGDRLKAVMLEHLKKYRKDQD